MADIKVVKMWDGEQELLYDCCSVFFLKSFYFRDYLVEICPWAKFHNNVNVFMVEECFVKFYNVGMVCLQQNVQFLLDRLEIFLDLDPAHCLDRVFLIFVAKSFSGDSNWSESAGADSMAESVNQADVFFRNPSDDTDIELPAFWLL